MEHMGQRTTMEIPKVSNPPSPQHTLGIITVNGKENGTDEQKNKEEENQMSQEEDNLATEVEGEGNNIKMEEGGNDQDPKIKKSRTEESDKVEGGDENIPVVSSIPLET